MQQRPNSWTKHLINELLRIILVEPLWGAGSAHQTAPPFLVSGSPRSGTTWMLEMLERQFDARRNWEPLDGIEQQLGPTAGRRQFGLRPYVAPGDDAHPLAPLLLGIVDGAPPRQLSRLWNPKMGPVVNLRRTTHANNTIVKFTEAQRCLPFIVRRRKNRALVLLRNPLSVTASALTYAGERGDEPPPGPVPANRRLPPGLVKRFPVLEKYVDRSMTRAQYIGLSTCIDMLVPISDPECRREYAFAAYESLKDRTADFDGVLTYFGAQEGEMSAEYLREPSARARRTSRANCNSDAGDWEGRLLPGEAEAILDIAHDLGIDWYSDEPGLNVSRLRRHNFAKLIA